MVLGGVPSIRLSLLYVKSQTCSLAAASGAKSRAEMTCRKKKDTF